MEKRNLFTIGALVIAVIVIGVIGYSVRKPVVNVSVEPADVNVGAMPGPQVAGNAFTIGGLTHWAYTTPVRNSTTTVCSIMTPAATSTLISAGINLTTGTSTAFVFTIGYATGSNTATTTSLGYVHSWSGKGVMIASSTPASFGSTMVDNSLVFAPSTGVTASSTWLNFKYGPTPCKDTTANCNGLVGTCWAEFISVP